MKHFLQLTDFGRDEFELMYQPIVSLDTGRVRRFEALVEQGRAH